ncbi:hypothetical protein GV827_02830 [Sulfitobacter sp. JBTF-M27]|jgi:hypothetical protein|uniref:Uncharacterized protein n=1 Tax=Sulfitobacter sediminilitoris TaxID=2698830 RepID=A0A6P0C8B1_9RHOB|nr:hypothetical protein [Sulfitobacter sediminilitoris]NEK21336.1 hypothetical protein [Sulfitobacter sediminilitoris]
MADTCQTLEVSKEDFAVIEAALHTQSKILHVQASAGGRAARDRLNDTKRVLATLAQQKPVDQNGRRCVRSRWFGMARIFG